LGHSLGELTFVDKNFQFGHEETHQLHRTQSIHAKRSISLHCGQPWRSIECVGHHGGLLTMTMPEFHQLVNEAKKEIQEIGPPDLKKMQEAKEDFVLIDVREPDETARGTIPGAVAIPRGKLELTNGALASDNEKKGVTYCR